MCTRSTPARLEEDWNNTIEYLVGYVKDNYHNMIEIIYIGGLFDDFEGIYRFRFICVAYIKSMGKYIRAVWLRMFG